MEEAEEAEHLAILSPNLNGFEVAENVSAL